MRLVKAVVAYDGTAFSGWQIQKTGATVQGVIHKALHQIHGRPVRTVAASRTDTGVHAEGQVIHFESESRLTDAKLKRALNYHLPPAVAVRSLVSLKSKFHARYGAKAKLYRYVIYTGRTKPVFERPHVWWLPHRLDAAAMRRAARHLTGRHDFTSFSTPGEEEKNRVRTIFRLSVLKKGQSIVIEAKADGFLYNMVRIIVGTLVQAGNGKIRPEDIPAMLAAKDRRKAGPTAAPQGLRLIKVYY